MNRKDAACDVEPTGSDAETNTFSSSKALAIDRSVLGQLNALVARGGNEPFAVRAARLYLKTSASMVVNMEAGFVTKDANAVYLAAHTLKSSSYFLGARVLARMAAEMEAFAQRGTLDGAASQLEELSREYQRTRQELIEFIDESTRGIST